MSCATNSQSTRKAYKILQGEDRDLPISLSSKNSCNETQPYDLTGATEITAEFDNQDGTVLTKTLTGGGITIISEVGGRINIEFTAAETALLKLAQMQTFCIAIVIGGKTRISKLVDALTVEAC